jgi:ribosome biogenesis GTPase
MSFLDDEGFQSLGWNPQLQFYFDELKSSSLVPARILSEDRSHYSVQLPNATLGKATLLGKFRKAMNDGNEDKPAVGDWVACEIPPSNLDSALIHALLPRKTCVKRAKPGGTSQIIVCNIDSIFITTSANDEFNLKRLDRYVSITFDSGAEPIIILTKTDLMKKNELEQLKEHFPSVQIYGVNHKDSLTYAPLYKYLQKGLTVGLMGSSGVGKSTLVNHVMGYERQKTEHIRDTDAKGRHTTTRREFLQTPFGGWIVDTPGMRELGMLDQQIGVDSQFSDILALAKNCRFKDCEHQSEPGCAISKALQKNELDQERWNSYLKLKAEIDFYEKKVSQALEAEKRKSWKRDSRKNE